MNPSHTSRSGKFTCALAALAITAGVLAWPTEADAAVYARSSGNWTTADAWAGATLANSTSTVRIGGGYTITFSGTTKWCDHLRIGSNVDGDNPGDGQLNISGGTLYVRDRNNDAVLIGAGGSRTGIVNHTNGNFRVRGGITWGNGFTSHYYLRGGTLHVGYGTSTNESIFDGATANQSNFYLQSGSLNISEMINLTVDNFHFDGGSTGGTQTFTWSTTGPAGMWRVNNVWGMGDSYAASNVTFRMNASDRNARAQNGITFGLGTGLIDIDAGTLTVYGGNIVDGTGSSKIWIDGGTLDVRGGGNVTLDDLRLMDGGSLPCDEIGSVIINTVFDFRGNTGTSGYGEQINW